MMMQPVLQITLAHQLQPEPVLLKIVFVILKLATISYVLPVLSLQPVLMPFVQALILRIVTLVVLPLLPVVLPRILPFV